MSNWIQYLQALATPVIALLVAVVGILQWRTAHQRAVLDLFDRRMDAYEAIRKSLAPIITSGQTNQEAFNEFARTISRVPFMFGDKVVEYLGDLKKQISTHLTLSDQRLIDAASEQERARYTKIKGDAFSKVNAFYDEFPTLIKSYVRMHQKAPWF